MTVSTVKSVNITNIELLPSSPLVRKLGSKRVVFDKIALETTSIDEIGDIVLLGSVPSNAVILSIKIFNDDLDAHATPLLASDVGLYYSGKGGNQIANGKTSGTVIDADCFSSAITTLQAANVTGVELRFEADPIENIGDEAWAIGGLASDPGGLFYIGLTITAAAATAAAGDVVLVVEYI